MVGSDAGSTVKLASLTHYLTSAGGGISTALSSLVSELDVLGVSSSVFGLQVKDQSTRTIDWGNSVTETAAVVGPAAIGYSPQLHRVIHGSNPDILHLHGIWMYPSRVAWQWHMKTSRPYVVSPHGMLDPWALANSRWKKRIASLLYERKNLATASCLHALCDSELKAIRGYGLKNPVCVIPNGIDVLPMPGDDINKERVILFLGRIHPKKGLSELIAAWANLSRDHSDEIGDWRLVIAGWDDGGHLESLKNDVANAGLVGSVEFVGPVFGDEKVRLLRKSSAFILPSFSEGLPMTILEAWSLGLPVVMTDHCHLPEGFANNAAIRIQPEVASVRDGILSCIRMPEEERQQMGRRGYDLVRRQFSWNFVGTQMHRVYDWLLGSGEVPDCVDFV